MGIMSIIGTIIVGFIVGFSRKPSTRERGTLSFLMTVALGIDGSVVGGVISILIFRVPRRQFHPAGWILSILGAVILLGLIRTPRLTKGVSAAVVIAERDESGRISRPISTPARRGVPISAIRN